MYNHINSKSNFVFQIQKLKRDESYFDSSTGIILFCLIKVLEKPSLKVKYASETAIITDLMLKIQAKQSVMSWSNKFLEFYKELLDDITGLLEQSNFILRG